MDSKTSHQERKTNRSRALCDLPVQFTNINSIFHGCRYLQTAPLLLQTTNLVPNPTQPILNQLLLQPHHKRDEYHQYVNTTHHGPAYDLRTAAYQASQHPLHSGLRSPYARACQEFHSDYQVAAAIRIISPLPLQSVCLDCSVCYSYCPRVP